MRLENPKKKLEGRSKREYLDYLLWMSNNFYRN
jgi:hypothetical protein